MANRRSNMLFSLHLIISVGPADFGSTDNLKRQSQSIFLSFNGLIRSLNCFHLFQPLPGTARQYQNARGAALRQNLNKADLNLAAQRYRDLLKELGQ
jgi:hypothetical protein